MNDMEAVVHQQHHQYVYASYQHAAYTPPSLTTSLHPFLYLEAHRMDGLSDVLLCHVPTVSTYSSDISMCTVRTGCIQYVLHEEDVYSTV